MIRPPIMRLRPFAILPYMLAGTGFAADDPVLKRDAIQRRTASHDPAIVIGVGRVYIKQLGLAQARALIAQQGRAAGLGVQWNDQVPQWRQAERRLTAVVDEQIRAYRRRAGG
jgi:hypothetical protein